jgi:hypothetical protein
VGAERICSRLARYVSAYYSEIRNQLARYSSIQEAFPAFLRGPKRVVAMLCTDGILLSHWAAEKDGCVCQVKRLTMREAARLASRGAVVFDYSPGGAVDVQFAEATLYEGPDGTGPAVWRAPWNRVEVSSKLGPSRWGTDYATTTAVNHVLSFDAAHLMQMQDAKQPDILNRLSTSIEEFDDMLRQTPREEDLQVFLSEHHILLSPIAVNVLPKHRLGSEYITDFVIHQAGGDYVLVEIEAASHKLFVKRGHASAALSRALQQVEDWRHWVHDHIQYARESLPGISEPDCWVIIGRDSSLSAKGRKALRRKNIDLSHTTILTFDELLNRARRHLDNLTRLP